MKSYELFITRIKYKLNPSQVNLSYLLVIGLLLQGMARLFFGNLKFKWLNFCVLKTFNYEV